MTRFRNTWLAAAAAITLSACGADENSADTVATNDVADPVAAKPAADAANIPTKASSPFTITYELIGTPIVGSPVTLNLQVASAFGATTVDISYRITDATALMLHESQPETLRAEIEANEAFVEDRVTVIPQREGRVYLNVEASVPTSDGRTSTTVAIPIHVGAVDTSLVEHGELETNEEGETTRVLTSE